MYTLEEKLQIIERAENFEELKSSGILPEPCFDDGYYFVSYSHRDFKRVIPEILSLQEAGVKIWYDRGLEAGTSWLKDVCRKIASFRCKGVIVYSSDSFCASASCAREIEQIGESQKSALLIQIEPRIPDGLYADFVLAYECPTEDKVAALRALPQPELYDFYIGRVPGLGKCATLRKVNDQDIKRAEIPAFVRRGRKRYPVRCIEERAFAFCYNLYEVVIPDGWSVISHGAFLNCYSLQRVVFGRPYTRQPFNMRRHYGLVTFSFMNCTSLVSVETSFKKHAYIAFDNAFRGCTALREVNLGDTGVYLENCFSRCSSLECVTLGKSQDKEEFPGVFYGCSALKNVRYSEKAKGENIPPRTYAHCSSLEYIPLPKNVRGISEHAFAHCENLREIHLPPTMKTVSATAFENAQALKTVTVDSALTFPADGKFHSIEETFAYAETFYIKKGLKFTFSEKFKELPGSRDGYTTYGRKL